MATDEPVVENPQAPTPPLYEGDLPPQASGRLERAAFSSGLTVPDFAACLHMGMVPVGLVQGFCVMRWGWTGYIAGYTPGGSVGSGAYYGGSRGYGSTRGWGHTLKNYTCPHRRNSIPTDAEHRRWGANMEQPWVTKAWADGFNKAYRRMIEEATEAGAHGVVGIHDSNRALITGDVREFHLLGTAVVIEGAPKPKKIWTTYLAGQRLAKLIEAGFMPVTILASMTSVWVSATCEVELLRRGRSDFSGVVTPGDEITQVADAHMAARLKARDHLRGAIGNDALHGASIEVTEREHSEGDMEVACTLRGTRVRAVADTPPLPPATPTVRLS